MRRWYVQPEKSKEYKTKQTYSKTVFGEREREREKQRETEREQARERDRDERQ